MARWLCPADVPPLLNGPAAGQQAVQAAAAEAGELLRQNCKPHPAQLIGDPSDANRPFAIDFESLFALALIHSQTRPSERGSGAPSSTSGGAGQPPLAPPVPVAVVNAAETLLQKLHHSGKLLDVLVCAGAELLWPTATLRLLRCVLLMHLETTGAAIQPPRLRVFHVCMRSDGVPRHPGQLPSEPWPSRALPELLVLAGDLPLSGRPLLPIREYVRGRVPNAFFFESPSALLPLIVRSAPTVFEATAQRTPGPGDRPRATTLSPEDRLAGVSLCIALAAVSAGLGRARLVSPGDAFNEKTGTKAPVAFFRQYAVNHDVNPDIVRLGAAYEHALTLAAADDGISMDMVGRSWPIGQGRVTAGRPGAGPPSVADSYEQAGRVSIASSEAITWDEAGRAVASAARGESRAAAPHSVSRVIVDEVLAVCVVRDGMAEELADAWHAHGAAAELPLHARASVAVPWEQGDDGAGHAVRAELSEGARLQGVIEEFSAAALPVVRRAWGEVGRAGAWGGAADGVFAIPLGIRSGDASAATTARPDSACMRLRDACIDLYDPRLLSQFVRALGIGACKDTTSAASDDLRSESLSPAQAPPAWRGLHRLRCRSKRQPAACATCTKDVFAVTSDTAVESSDSTKAPVGLDFRASGVTTGNAADGGGTSAAREEGGDDGGTVSAAMRAEAAALEAAAAAAMAAPSAGAVAAFQLLQTSPRIQEAGVAGTALDLTAEGVKFAFADTDVVPGGHSGLFFDAVAAAAAEAGGGAGDVAAWDEAAADLEAGAVAADADAGASGSKEVDLASIADVSEITMAKKEAEDAAALQQCRNPRRQELKLQYRYQTYLEKYASTLRSGTQPTPRQQLMLVPAAAVQVAAAAEAPTKHKSGGGKRRNLKAGQGAPGGRKVKADAARETEARSRREGREKVRGWVRAAAVDSAVKGTERASVTASLTLLRHEGSLRNLCTSGRDAVAEIEFYTALLRCQARLAQLEATATAEAAASIAAAGAAADAAAAAAFSAPMAVDVYTTVRYMEHACVPALPSAFSVWEDAGVCPEALARVPEVMVGALRGAGLRPLAARLHAALATAEPVRRLAALLNSAAGEKSAATAVRRAAKVMKSWLGGTGEAENGAEAVEWQLRRAGAHLTRTIDAQPDKRVKFLPDRWQLDMLDAVDARKSLLVIAPTSSGKTFVSYYTMRHVLDANLRRRAGQPLQRVVFVMPTKALIIQTQGDLYNSYRGYISSSDSSASVFASWSRDFRDPGYMTAQILITVPEILEAMLYSTAREHRAWVASLKYVIVDEVHNIVEVDRGDVYERLFAALPCPIIALSASVSNPHALHGWIKSIQQRKGQQMADLVLHRSRWADLDVQLYRPVAGAPPIRPGDAAWRLGVPLDRRVGGAGAHDFVRVHPLALYSTRPGEDLVSANQHCRGLVLSPAEALQLFEAMSLCLTVDAVATTAPEATQATYSEASHPTDAGCSSPGSAEVGVPGVAAAGVARATPGEIADLHPGCRFAGQTFLTLEGVRQWSLELLRRLEELTLQPHPWLTRAVVAHLARGLWARGGDEDGSSADAVSTAPSASDGSLAGSSDEFEVSGDEVEEAALGESSDDDASQHRSKRHHDELQEEKRQAGEVALARARGPYIRVNNMLLQLDAAGQLPAIVFHLQRAGCTRRVLALAAWLKAALAERAGRSYEELLEEQEVLEDKLRRARAALEATRSAGKRLSPEREEHLVDAVTRIEAQMKHPLAAFRSFSFAGVTANLTEEATHFLRDLRRSDWAAATAHNRLLIQALDFGIAVHHAGVSIKYRRAAEVLFRCGRVRVMFATGTLAQGLNMPARTVAFDGDSEFFNPMTFQQMAGRAGRRGFDVAGRVVFCNTLPERVAALACAEIPPAHGTLMLSATNTLRVLSGNLPARDIATLLMNPIAQRASPAPSLPLRHTLFLFNVVLLQQRRLLDARFRPAGLMHLVSRMHYHACSAVLFLVDLIETGVLNAALRAVPRAEQPARLLEVLACVFNRMPLHHDTVRVARTDALSGMLPPLRELCPGAHAALHCANALTLQMLTAHLRTAAVAGGGGAAAAQARRAVLPFSGLALGAWSGTDRGREALRAHREAAPQQCPAVTVVRSPFSGRYRLGDDFESAEELEEQVEASLQGMAGAMPVLPLDVPLSNYAVVFYKGSAACSGRGGFKAAVATSGIREDIVYTLVKDWSILLRCLRAACCGTPLAGATRTLADTFGALFEGTGYV